MLDYKKYNAVLAASLEDVIAELKTIAQQNPVTLDWEAIPNTESLDEPDENAEADAFEETEERQATLGELETSYRNLTRALEKIELGTFGTCELCGEIIETERLDVLPTARTCKVHRDDERTLSL